MMIFKKIFLLQECGILFTHLSAHDKSSLYILVFVTLLYSLSMILSMNYKMMNFELFASLRSLL